MWDVAIILPIAFFSAFLFFLAPKLKGIMQFACVLSASAFALICFAIIRDLASLYASAATISLIDTTIIVVDAFVLLYGMVQLLFLALGVINELRASSNQDDFSMPGM